MQEFLTRDPLRLVLSKSTSSISSLTTCKDVHDCKELVEELLVGDGQRRRYKYLTEISKLYMEMHKYKNIIFEHTWFPSNVS